MCRYVRGIGVVIAGCLTAPSVRSWNLLDRAARSPVPPSSDFLTQVVDELVDGQMSPKTAARLRLLSASYRGSELFASSSLFVVQIMHCPTREIRVTNSYVVVGASDLLFPVGSLAVLAVIVIVAALWLWSLADALRTNDQTWKAAGQNKLVWVVVIVLLGPLGPVLYLAVPKRALKTVPV